MAVIKDGEVVGHAPTNLAPKIFQFLRRDVNKAFIEVTGTKVEVPCIWPICTMKEIVD